MITSFGTTKKWRFSIQILNPLESVCIWMYFDLNWNHSWGEKKWTAFCDWKMGWKEKKIGIKFWTKQRGVWFIGALRHNASTDSAAERNIHLFLSTLWGDEAALGAPSASLMGSPTLREMSGRCKLPHNAPIIDLSVLNQFLDLSRNVHQTRGI